MSRWNLAWLLAVPMVVILGFTLSYSAPNRERDKDYQLVRTVVDVLAEVDQHYVRELDDKARQKLVEDMINGGLERLDPYSQYLNAEEYHHFETQSEGNFGGVGIQLGVDPKTGNLMVISPMVGTPALEAGILAGDLIIKVDGKSTEGMRMGDAVKVIQGEPGTPISLTVLHENSREPATYTMNRARIEIETVLGYKRLEDNPKEWEWFADKDNGIAYIRLVQFNEHTAADLRKAVERVQREGAKSLILDLRDNPGGLLTAAIEVSDMFLTGGRIVSTRDRFNRGRAWDAKEADTIFEPAKAHPVALLVNKNSASASEIVAAALQDNHRAVVVGERSFGKGSVQKVIRLNEGGQPTALKLTTDTYWRPNGKNIHRHPDDKDTDEWGVKPDPGFEVVLKDDERLEYLKYRRSRDVIRRKEAPKSDAKEDKPYRDKALEKAVEHLKKENTGVGAVPFIDLSTGIGA
jgi:carboxyl-terminal processing protease